MPFTPIHMGPGILIKSILQGSFSLMVFGWAQILMDIQPLLVLLTGAGQLHGFSHTYIGAFLIALFSALSGKYLSEFGLRLIGIAKRDNLIIIGWWVVVISAFIGTYSHVLLDSIMHSDIQPFYPFILENDMLKIISIKQLHQWCLYSGLIGTGLYYLLQIYFKKYHKKFTSIS